ncbi:MAG TPA: hypothetical protein DCY54_05445 [Parachlamydiales bacterium]|nr:MAG: hypothetical protein A2Z85_03525 [Chlamydiae bacterium GWA2_50_15]OGN54518.1 MAG: hypothetical protein A2098_04105 [Chlamydiae bacterium GWF2_49_8]OGN58595.1 MAG: hypothetical protein A3D18_00540 [Chlamydiae bacterium RIFCSPHIGHO2_02_FULL_49_29]OGN64425.1 MAG: hypothetical protein A3E26_05625 [Chlamydiae bacterium RIFCSPHIGHO2_12_FULL_49_32]OGN68529.1 MAG: hypothetical protein A3I15_01350 [Chlamydiae bacterium RIFCSPLOWO2_02_FULL_49_12]HAZ16056.1 hypothetical protein [Parachlamydiales 
MPVLWRYLLRNYFKVLILCLTSFISILLIIRFKEIAQFASSGSSFAMVVLFTLYQIPYILPIALPISGLIAPILLFQRLSHTHELTAFRASGLGLKPIIFPLLLAGGFLTLLNFAFVSELSPHCRTLSKTLIYKMTADNPLFLTQKESLIRIPDALFDIHSFEPGKEAKGALVLFNNRTNGRSALFLAKRLYLDHDYLKGEKVGLITSSDPKQEDIYDHLIIENQKTMATKAANLAPFIQNLEGSLNYDYMPLRLILARKLFKTRDHYNFTLSRGHLEIIRRLSFALAAFTFTFIGVSFGMQIGRDRKKRGIVLALFLSSFTLICFLAAKSIRHSPLASSFVYLLPHPLVMLSCLFFLRRISRGIE